MAEVKDKTDKMTKVLQTGFVWVSQQGLSILFILTVTVLTEVCKTQSQKEQNEAMKNPLKIIGSTFCYSLEIMWYW